MNKITLLLATPLLIALTACNADEDITADGANNTPGGELTLLANDDDTRVAINDNEKTSVFQDGDEVGIFIVRKNTTADEINAGANHSTAEDTKVWKKNMKTTYRSSDKRLMPDTAEGTKWPTYEYDRTGAEYDVYAYYPYQAGLTDITQISGTVATDQRQTGNAGLQGAFVFAQATVKFGEDIRLTFRHALSLIDVKLRQAQIDERATAAGGNAANHVLIIEKALTNYTFNLFQPAIQATGTDDDKVNVYFHACPAEGTTPDATVRFRALLPAQDLGMHNPDPLDDYSPFRHYIDGIDDNLGYFGGRLAAPSGLHLGSYTLYDFSQVTNLEEHGAPKMDVGITLKEIGHLDRPMTFERNGHTITITDLYQLSETEVTNEQYCKFLNRNNIGADAKWTACPDDIKAKVPTIETRTLVAEDNGIYNKHLGVHYVGGKWEPETGMENHPVVCVSWYGARAFCLWLGGDLPTQAQWEYAARTNKNGQAQTLASGYWWGMNWDNAYGWCYNNAPKNADNKAISSPVATATREAAQGGNGWGLYDMAGNAMEWTLDADNGEGTAWPTADMTDPLVTPAAGQSTTFFSAVTKGGAFSTSQEYCTYNYRTGNSITSTQSDFIGFRLYMR